MTQASKNEFTKTELLERVTNEVTDHADAAGVGQLTNSTTYGPVSRNAGCTGCQGRCHE